MSRVFLLSVVLLLTSFVARSQEVTVSKTDSVTRKKSKIDTLKPKYVNPGKIAGKQAMLRSAMLPGLGQIRNGFTFYRGLKVAGIYTGATLLTLSFIDNTKQYHVFLDELKFRALNNDKSPVGSPYASYSTSGLIQAKDTYRRNREVVIYSYIGLYLLNVIEAYIDARLQYFDVGEGNIALKVRPTMINSDRMYGLNPPAPGLKISLAL